MLTASQLTRRFDDRVAVQDVSFDVAAGEIFALLGPNGAGKTTTLRMLAGLIEPTSGTVQIGPDVMTRHTATHLRGRIGFLTEAPGLWDRLPVRQNLRVYARLHGLPEAARDVRGLILRLRDEGRAILLSTHNLDEVERVANRVAVLRGHLVASGTP